MSFWLQDCGWSQEIASGMSLRPSLVRVVCPFIKRKAAARFLKAPVPNIQVITRFDLNCFNAGVSDVEALEDFVRAGARVRGIVGLHSKMYLFGDDKVVVTSANLTEAAMFTNQELGFVATEPGIVVQCGLYFEKLWAMTSIDLTLDMLAEWSEHLQGVRPNTFSAPSLPDFGEVVSLTSPFVGSEQPDVPIQSFVKFFGRANNRADLAMPIALEVQRSGSNWACTYPTGKRPRQVKDGAVMFMARMMEDRSDYRIYGRAIGREHTPDIDDATAADIAKRPWKTDWSHYVRVHDPIFIDGPLSAAISMADMMEELGANAFAPTLRNLLAGSGNTNPRKSLVRKPSMELTPVAYDWISSRLDAALLKHGALDLTGPEYDQPA